MQANIDLAQLRTPDELRVIGPKTIASATETALEAIQDQEQLNALVAQLAAFVDQPRDDDASMNEAGADIFDLVCTAYAVLEAADRYGDAPNERETAQWLRNVAKKCIYHVADQFGRRAAIMAEETHPETRH